MGLERFFTDTFELFVQKTHVKRGVVDDDFSVAQVGQNFFGQLCKLGLVAQKLIADAVHLERVFVTVALGVEVKVQVVAGQLAGIQLHTAEFNDAVTAFGRQACGFGVQNNLAHGRSPDQCSSLAWLMV